MNSKKAPIDINISAKLKIAKYFTAIKSVTKPKKTRSNAFDIAPESISVYEKRTSFIFLYFS